jgi:hypothetical protein
MGVSLNRRNANSIEMKNVISTLLICLSALTAFTQLETPQCLFYGYAEEGQFENPDAPKRKRERPPHKLESVKIYVYIGETLLSTQEARESGFYALLLDAGKRYRVVFEKEGYFCKCIELDCQEVVFPSNEASLKCLADISLFRKVEDDGLLNLCKYPFARCAFNTETKEMEWDMEYTDRTKQKFYQLAEPYYLAERK